MYKEDLALKKPNKNGYAIKTNPNQIIYIQYIFIKRIWH